jgi:hypothetical protein
MVEIVNSASASIAQVLTKWAKQQPDHVLLFAPETDQKLSYGQMALEALSRGFNKVHLFEIDTKRFSGLKKNLSQYSENMIFHHKDSFRYFDKIEENENFSLVYFLDPPYTFWEGTRMLALIDSLKAMKNCKKIYVQSPKIFKDWEKEGRRFGNCYISELS